MRKSLIFTICLTMLLILPVTVKDSEAVNFEGQEDKYMKLCSSSTLSNSNYKTCKEFNSYLKEKNQNLQSSIDSSQQDISETQQTLDSVVSQIAELNSQIQAKQEEITYLETSIANLEASILKKEDEIKERMYAMQSYNNSNSYIEYVFGAESFSDFFMRVDSVNEITEYDEQLIVEINDEKEQVKVQKDTAETAKANIEAQKAEQQTLQTQYENLLAEQQQALASAQAQQQEISSTQSSLDAYLSAVIVQAPATTTTTGGGTSNNSSSNSGSTTITPPQNVPTTNKYGATVVAAARSKLGCPYVWGASGPNSFDCSGLVMWCYAQAGVYLDHYSGSQKNSGAIIPLSQAQPGDILWKSGHVGIYIGGGQYIHAPQTGDVVKIASNVGRFTCAVRPY